MSQVAAQNDLLCLESLSKITDHNYLENLCKRLYKLRFENIPDSLLAEVQEKVEKNDGNSKAEEKKTDEEEEGNVEKSSTSQKKDAATRVVNMLKCVLQILKLSVYHKTNTKEDVAAKVFNSKSFTNARQAFSNQKIKTVMLDLTDIILKNLDSWHASAISSQLSLPKLLEMKWRVDVRKQQKQENIQTQNDTETPEKKSSSVLFEFELMEGGALCGKKEEVSKKGVMEKTRNVQFEMNAEELDLMLKGLSRIRDQLKAVQ